MSHLRDFMKLKILYFLQKKRNISISAIENLLVMSFIFTEYSIRSIDSIWNQMLLNLKISIENRAPLSSSSNKKNLQSMIQNQVKISMYFLPLKAATFDQ